MSPYWCVFWGLVGFTVGGLYVVAMYEWMARR